MGYHVFLNAECPLCGYPNYHMFSADAVWEHHRMLNLDHSFAKAINNDDNPHTAGGSRIYYDKCNRCGKLYTVQMDIGITTKSPTKAQKASEDFKWLEGFLCPADR